MDKTNPEYQQWRAELARRLNIDLSRLDAYAEQHRLYLHHAYFEAHLTVDEILEDFGQ